MRPHKKNSKLTQSEIFLRNKVCPWRIGIRIRFSVDAFLFTKKPFLSLPVSFLLPSTVSPYLLSCPNSVSTINPEYLATP
jgi:hypothetical protein